MTGASSDILICVEDPGAANMVIGLTAAITSLGKSAKLIAGGLAQGHLTAAREPFEPLAKGETAVNLLSHVDPKTVAAGSAEAPDAFGLSLIDAAKHMNLQTVGIIDGPANAACRFRGRTADPMAHAPDHIIAPDRSTASHYIELGLPGEAVVACGHPAFDRARTFAENRRTSDIRQFRQSFPGFDGDRPLWVFAAEISDGLAPEAFKRQDDYSLRGRGQSDDRTCIVLEEVLDAVATLSPRPYLILRLHPKNSREEFAAFEQEIDYFSQGGDVLELVAAADLVLGMTSVLLSEAVVSGTPAVSIVPRAVERDWLLAADLIPVASDRDAIRKLLHQPPSISMPAVHECITFGATDRMAEYLVGLTAEK